MSSSSRARVDLDGAGEPTRVHVALNTDPSTRARLLDTLERAGFVVTFSSDAEGLARALPELEYLLLGRPPRLDWSSAARLRLIHVAGSGVDPLFPARGLRPEVVVSNSRGAHADSVRDHVLGTLLAFARELPSHIRSQAQRQWRPRATRTLVGQRLCVVGLGEIGGRVALAATALGIHVVGVSRTARPSDGVARVFSPTALHDALRDADYVVVCVPSTASTRGLFDRATLAVLPSHAVLISVARGDIVDERALEELLRAGRLRGAALDVFAHEPLPGESSLWDCPGLLLTPHVAGLTVDYFEPVLPLFIDAVAQVAAGESPKTRVSRELEY